VSNFVVYKSSAGSGKTFTLVKEYLRLALYDENKLSYNYKRILALTFTNKAASEMKSRVIDALHQMAYDKTPPFISELLGAELNITAVELKKRSAYVLSHILHHYSDFSIGTIDSFTHKIVKTFAHDLELPVNFNIEMDTEGFYEQVISTLFNQIGEDDYVSKLLKEYVLTKAEDNVAWDPEKQIQEFARLLQKEHSEEYITQLKQFNAAELENFRKQFLDFISHYKSTLKTEAQKAIRLIQEHHLTDNDFTYKKNGPQNFFKKCLTAELTLQDASASRISDAVAKNKWSGNASQTSHLAIEKISPALNTIALELIQFIQKNYAYFLLCDVLSKQMYPLMLLKKIEEISLEKKQEEKIVFISEFNHKIFEIINNEPTPFIYERLGERYHHYLLDEFQDTSSLQWQNILPLLDNSLSNGWFNLIVGDGKQSIYRWRNANVKQFAQLPQLEKSEQSNVIQERAQTLARNFEGRVLDTNYRSLKTIIDFNNSLFDFLSNNLLSDAYKPIYSGQAQKIKKEALGYVTINAGKVEKDIIDDYTYDLVKQKISAALSDGFDYKDICILARKNSHGNSIANYLMQQKIPIVSSDSLLLKNNLEVNTILCYLNYLANNQDVVNAAAVINYLFQSKQISEDKFHTYLKELSNDTSLFDILKACGININPKQVVLNNLLDNCIAIINALNLNANGHQYIRFFLDEVNEFLVLKNSNITAFFDWWKTRSKKASMVIPENTNAVKIMTIHSSKGLEFPVVIIPYCNWTLYKINESWVNIHNTNVGLSVGVIPLSEKVKDIGFELELETEKQEQCLDNLNLLYVAFTRAVERLHIITTAPLSNNFKLVSHWIDDFIAANYPVNQHHFYELGKATHKQLQDKHSHSNTFDLNPLTFTKSTNVVQLKASYLNNTLDVEEAKQQGLMMHWVLSKIKSNGDLDAAIELAIFEGILQRGNSAELKAKLVQLLQHQELAAYYIPDINCKLEAELITENGELLRPDRIVFDTEHTVLIDYKTGKENNTKYFRQLLKYETALVQMGYKNIKKLLVYVDDLMVVTVK
jgi:ATP-dependent exoDNAse (exonuclease V) beta subunit